MSSPYPTAPLQIKNPDDSKIKCKIWKKSLPTLTKKTVKGAGVKKKAKKAAAYVGKISTSD